MGLTNTFTHPYYVGMPGLSPGSPAYGEGIVNLLGASWMLDLTGREFTRRTIQMQRDQLDVGDASGEQSLSSGLLWMRSVTSWHKGAGQRYYDDRQDRDPDRFWYSRHVDVWTRGQVTLLPSTRTIHADPAVNQWITIVDSELWWVAGDTVSVFDDPVEDAVASATFTAAPTAVAGAGDRMYACVGDTLVQAQRSAATVTVTTVLPGTRLDGVTFQAGRLFVWAGPNLWEVRFSPAATLTLISQRPTGFRWLGVRQASGNLVAVGDDGARGTLWRLPLSEDGSGWAPPQQILELPDGERVLSGDAYLGFVLLSTTAGLRMIALSPNGDAQTGPPMEVPVSGAVGFEGQGRFVWAGMTHADLQSGLVRLDLSTFTEPLAPAWAPDLEAWETPSQRPLTGLVQSITTYRDRLLFTVSGSGLLMEADVPETFGQLEQGIMSWGTSDVKTPTDWTLLSEPLPGDAWAGVRVISDDNANVVVVTHRGAGRTRSTGAGTSRQNVMFLPSLVLYPDENGSRPVITRWDVRAAPTTRRATMWTLPLLLSERLDFGGHTVDRDPATDYDRLVEAVLSGRVTTLSLDHSTHVVQPVEFEWRPMQRSKDGVCWEGTFIIQCLTVEGTR